MQSSHGQLLAVSFAVCVLATIATSAKSNEQDVIIVDAGTSGCVLAARLCEAHPSAKILPLQRATPRTEKEEFVVRAPRNIYNAFVSPPPHTNVSLSSQSRPAESLRNRSYWRHIWRQ